MPRPAEGPRLYLRTGRAHGTQGKRRPDVWVIRDGAVEVSTGCSAESVRAARRALANYIAGAAPVAPAPAAIRSAAAANLTDTRVGIAEILTLYADDRAPELATDPATMAGFIRALVEFWGDKFVDEVRRSSCKAYVAHRTRQTVKGAQPGRRKVSDQTARRELEVLSAAIGYWDAETPLLKRPKVWLPPKPESPRDAITRSQAAALLLASRGYRRDCDGRMRRLEGSQRANRAHLARFILIGLYTGTRTSAILALLWTESSDQAWIDLDGGMIYRRGRREREHRNKRRPIARLPRRLRAHLRRWRRLDENEAFDRQTPVTHVIHHGGAPIAAKVNKGFGAVARDAGLAEVTPHWLRHTCATWLMEASVDLWEAAAYTGMTPAVLLKHYGHHRPDHHQGARSAFTSRRSA